MTIAVVFSSGGAGAGTVTIRVADTGLGIPARDLPHVFDKLYRVKSEATREIAGTGLGLAITRISWRHTEAGSASRASRVPERRSWSSCRSLGPDASGSAAPRDDCRPPIFGAIGRSCDDGV